jgi:hypothetical protein
MDPYLYINNYSISHDLCNDIINIFEKSEKRAALTIGGLNTNILHASKVMSEDITDDKWDKIANFLKNELSNNLKSYIHRLNSINMSNDYLYFSNEPILFDHFSIQKYDVNVSGKYKYHTDNFINSLDNTERCISFIWYLNSVSNGGETEFVNNIKITPEKGKLVLFPSTWTYPHCSRPVISNDKYIIVGWLMIKFKPK